jgi:hypothetical protein
LLPASFLKLLPTTPSRGDAVRLGSGLDAYRYTALAPKGLSNRLVTIYAVPTSGGVATVACVFGSSTPAAFGSQCQSAASSLELTSGKSYPLGPSESYAKTLRSALGSLNDSVQSQAGRLRSAKTPAGQASAAGTLSIAYGLAAGKLEKLRLSPADSGANALLASSLRKTARDYGQVTAAAGRGDRRAYGRAAGALRSDGRAVQRAISQLKALGYAPGF